MKNYIYSAVNDAFYPVELREMYEAAETWPIDGVAVDTTIFAEFSGKAPEGKIRAVGDDGFLHWVDAPLSPQPTTDELIAATEAEKQRLITEANAKILPLADAIDFGMATDNERQRYDAWRRYRVLLSRIDTAAVPVSWPTLPMA